LKKQGADLPFENAKKRFAVDLIDVSEIKNVIVDLRYNGTNNFMQEDLYQGFNKAYLHRHAFEKLNVAASKIKPGFFLLVLDALRPRSVQRKLRSFVAGTPYQEYVADPDLGSLHNFGMAIDLTLANEKKIELDMGTAFDDFSDLAQPKLEDKFLREEKLSVKQYENRLHLRQAMCQAGFEQLPHEWWHYNALPAEQVRKNYPIVE
jgi:zinc D-Ala-D-Ala dipeptidase